MEKIKISIRFLSIAAIILSIILIFSSFNLSQSITGFAAINSYSYTKAICDGTNYCEDYEINCYRNKFVNMKFTGASIQNSFDWKDPRDKETIEKLC